MKRQVSVPHVLLCMWDDDFSRSCRFAFGSQETEYARDTPGWLHTRMTH